MKLGFVKEHGMFCVQLEGGESCEAVVDACHEAGAVDAQGNYYVRFSPTGPRELLTPAALRQRILERIAKEHAPHCGRHARPELNVGMPETYRCTCEEKRWDSRSLKGKKA